MNQELSLSEIQDCENRILQFLAEICRKNGIRYYLYCGTLLGAVRHKGFIPWDDDIDIMVPRNDYIKLINILKFESKYRLLTYDLYDDYYYPFAKLVDPTTKVIENGVKECSELGIWVDIFPIDKVPRNRLLKKLQYWITQKLIGLNRYASSSEQSIKKEIKTNKQRIKYEISKLLSNRTVYNCIDWCAGFYRNSSSDEWADLLISNKYITYKSDWLEKSDLIEFEHELYSVPKEYTRLLTLMYGDYMKLPPENLRHAQHSYSCWKIDNENKET